MRVAKLDARSRHAGAGVECASLLPGPLVCVDFPSKALVGRWNWRCASSVKLVLKNGGVVREAVVFADGGWCAGRCGRAWLGGGRQQAGHNACVETH